MKCSACASCRTRKELFFCNHHNLEIFNPENAGCSYGNKSSLTLIMGGVNERTNHQKIEKSSSMKKGFLSDISVKRQIYRNQTHYNDERYQWSWRNNPFLLAYGA